MNTLLMVHNNGVVNQYEVVSDNDTLPQIIWNGHLHCTLREAGGKEHTYGTHSQWSIKLFRAIYLNGVMIVKHGKVYPRKRLLNRAMGDY